MSYQILNETHNGIERIIYRPNEPKFKTSLVFQHGAWHGAWCWRWWQELFAEWGWESHAFSLSNHGGSTRKGLIQFHTYASYVNTLKEQIALCKQPPVVIGHSMGGMITQRYLAWVGDLPAAVLVASIPLYDSLLRYFRYDAKSMLQVTLGFSTWYLVNTPAKARAAFLSEGALMTPEDLVARLVPESLLIALDSTRLTWHPRAKPNTPMLVLAAERDALFSTAEEKHLASFYGAEYKEFPRTAHNMMMEASYRESAQAIHEWLIAQRID